jgi:hypothetical protein
LAAARVEVAKAAKRLAALAPGAPPHKVAKLADRLISAAGEVYRHAHRVAESRRR